MHWCYNSNHLGVRGEVPRLIAWLLKHCRSFQPIPITLNINNLVRCLVEMISSNHAIMQNEAFYALNVLCFGSANDDSNDFVRLCVEADIGKHVYYIISKYADKPDEKSVDNLMSLLENLTKSSGMVEHFRSCGIKDALLKMQNAYPNKSRVILVINRI